jgi:type II secretion system protein C
MTFNLAERYPLVLNVLLAALVIPYLAARSVSNMIKLHYSANVVQPEPQTAAGGVGGTFSGTRPRVVYNAIVQRDVFNLTPAPVEAPPPPATTEDLKLTLLGTSHLSGNRAFAIFEDDSGDQQVYRLGETIPNVGKLVQVGRNRAVILHDGHRVQVEIPKDGLGEPASGDDDDSDSDADTMPRRFRRRHLWSPYIRNPMNRAGSPDAKAGGIRKLAPNQYAIERSAVNSNMQNMSQLFTEIRAVPDLQNGTSQGFTLSEIQPGSIFQQLGLEDGDILTAVSGQQVADPARAMQMLSTLQSRSSVTLNVLRNGAPVQLNYTIH